MTDQILVSRAQAGDRKAFDLLVLKYQHKIIALVSRLVYDPVEAQDIAQEAFIKAYRAINLFRGDSAFYTWLYRIATNTAKSYRASKNRSPIGTIDGSKEEAQYMIDAQLQDQATPEGTLLAEELQRVIFQAIDELPDELKEAITLREIENMSYKEIAVIMGCPTGTVRSRIFRARSAIDQKIPK